MLPIYIDNESVETYNMERLINLNKPITQITCENSNLKGKSGKASDFGGLANYIHLSTGCYITLTPNTRQLTVWNSSRLNLSVHIIN